jgi:hypothetical protein
MIPLRKGRFTLLAARYLAVCLAVVLGFAAIAIAGSGSRQTAKFTLSQKQPGKSTGERLVIDYVNPNDAAAKPPAVRRVVTVLPLKARFDTTAPARCTATDAELMLEGGSACPAGSRVGGGDVTVDTGAAGPGRFVEAQVEFFNNTNELIFLNTVRDSGARTVIRAEVRRHKTITVVEPPLPGTPPDGGAIDTVDIALKAVSRMRDGERRNYITTPPHCPPRGYWITAVRFIYRDGVGQTVKNRVRCEA